MAIQTGDKCPSFSLPDQNGNIISIDDLIGKKILVIYFYPKDYSGGCTAEACSFRDAYEEFKDAGCEVIGISGDSVKSHKGFAEKNRLTFSLLSDTKKEVRKLFGVPRAALGLIAGRVTYIVDLKGIVRNVHNSLVNTDSHIADALSIINSIKNENN